MNTLTIRKRTRSFTLVEIMVSVAALLLIMTFLFTFVLGSQRLWNASDHLSQSFDTSQTLLDVIGDDLRNMTYSNQIPDTRPVMVAKNVSIKFDGKAVNADLYLFISHFSDSRDDDRLGTYPVIYAYVGDKNSDSNDIIKSISYTLFRVPLVKNGDGGLSNLDAVKAYPQVDFTTSLNLAANNGNISDFTTAIASIDLKEEHILMTNVNSFDMSFLAPYDASGFWKTVNTHYEFATKQPRSAQIKLSVFSPNAIPEELWADQSTVSDREKLLQRYERSFSKTISLDTN